MKFDLKAFIKNGLLLAIGNKPDYEIILASCEWLKQGVFLESDLAEIETAINKKNENTLEE